MTIYILSIAYIGYENVFVNTTTTPLYDTTASMSDKTSKNFDSRKKPPKCRTSQRLGSFSLDF